MADLKSSHNLETGELCFIWWEILGLSPGDSISSGPERTALRREEPGYIEVFQQRAGSRNIKRLIKENLIRFKKLKTN